MLDGFNPKNIMLGKDKMGIFAMENLNPAAEDLHLILYKDEKMLRLEKREIILKNIEELTIYLLNVERWVSFLKEKERDRRI